MTEETTVDISTIEAEARAQVMGTEIESPAAAEEESPAEEEEGESEEESPADQELADDEEEPAEEESKDKRSKFIPRKRFDEVNERARLAEERIAAQEKELADIKAVLRESLTPKKAEAEPVELDPLDPESHNALKAEIDEIRRDNDNTAFDVAVKTENAIWSARVPNFDVMKDVVIAYDAMEILRKEHYAGNKITEKEAVDIAMYQAGELMRRMHKNGKSFGEYFVNRAQDIVKTIPVAGKKKPAGKSKIDMEQLGRLRDEAGAPTNKSASSKAVGMTMEAIEAEARKHVLEASQL